MLKLCPSSDTKSRKLTACIIQIIIVRANKERNKNNKISDIIFLKINFFIEI
tara:strand:+ start:203 stop:358 length:156 start_codon:yes stop_codon:yes gene_type:complete